MKRTQSICAAVLLAGVALPSVGLADELTAWRAFVSDQASGTVSVLDLDAGTVLEQFELEAPASLYASASGRRLGHCPLAAPARAAL